MTAKLVSDIMTHPLCHRYDENATHICVRYPDGRTTCCAPLHMGREEALRFILDTLNADLRLRQ